MVWDPGLHERLAQLMVRGWGPVERWVELQVREWEQPQVRGLGLVVRWVRLMVRG